jgi:hypothetical protein
MECWNTDYSLDGYLCGYKISIKKIKGGKKRKNCGLELPHGICINTSLLHYQLGYYQI